MAKNVRFLGCQYPLVKTPRGLLAQKSDVNQIKADMLQLLLTNPGERVMLPLYGTPLRKLIFEPNDPVLEIEAKKIIAQAIQKWEPRVEISNIFVSSKIPNSELSSDDTEDQAPYILFIRIDFFDPADIQQIEQLTLESPVGG